MSILFCLVAVYSEKYILRCYTLDIIEQMQEQFASLVNVTALKAFAFCTSLPSLILLVHCLRPC